MLFVLSIQSSISPGDVQSNHQNAPYTTGHLEASYTQHDPIFIDDDADFDTLGLSGDGSEASPYLIQNLWIEQNVTDSSCIRIVGTSAHFVITNCYFNTTYTDGYGISLQSIAHGIISNNTVVGLEFGIRYTSSISASISITGNWVNDSTFGILTDVSTPDAVPMIHNNTLFGCDNGIYSFGRFDARNNTCIGGTWGLYASNLQNSVISNNTFDGNLYGIALSGLSSFVSVENNTFEDCGNVGIEIVSTASNITVEWNQFLDCHDQASDSGSDNVFRYNYWSDYYVYDINGDGFGDDPYPIGGTAGTTDDYPRGEVGPLVLDWQGGVWINETAYQQTAVFAIDCQYYVYAPSIVHTDLNSTYTGEKGNVSAGQSTVTIYVEDRFFGASILFNASVGLYDWYSEVCHAGVSSHPPVETETTISFSNRYDCRAYWAFTIDGVIRETGIVNDSIYSEEYLTLVLDKDLSLGVHSYSFNITTNPANDYNWDIRTGTYLSEDTTYPTINHPEDILYPVGTLNHSITWTPYDIRPDTYKIFRNSILVQLGHWNASTETISINIDGLAIGQYEYTIVVSDITGIHDTTDTVMVTVVEETQPPIVGNLPDVDYYRDSVSYTLNWTVYDENPLRYELFRNGSVLFNNTWNSGEWSIEYDVGNECVGVYNITLRLTDTEGHITIDTVIVTCWDNLTPISINEPEDIEYVEGDIGYSIMWIVTTGNADYFELYRNGTLIGDGEWSDTEFTLTVDALSAGSYNFTLVVWNTEQIVSDTVWVFVLSESTSSMTTTATTTNTTTTTTDPIELASMTSLIVTIGSIAVIVIVLVSIYRAQKATVLDVQ